MSECAFRDPVDLALLGGVKKEEESLGELYKPSRGLVESGGGWRIWGGGTGSPITILRCLGSPVPLSRDL